MNMLIRTLRSGEERMWVRCGSPGMMDGEIENRAKHFADRQQQYPEDPNCFLVATDRDRCLGRLRGMLIHDNLYVISSVIVPELTGSGTDEMTGTANVKSTSLKNDAGTSPVTMALIAEAVSRNSGRKIEAVNWIRPEDDEFDKHLRQSGFRIECEKAFVERSLEDFEYSRIGKPDQFTYKTFAQAGRSAFVEILAAVLEQNINRDMTVDDPGTELDECIAHAASAFNPETWKLALLDGRLAGFVLPQLFHDDPEEGSIFNIGLLPEFRGKGLGRPLHARGLEDLKHMGATRYVGSTDILNVPMRRIFVTNGCHEKGIRRIYRI
ncbi:GNAT family N-acetyltransferase [bacterium]|nr:GNAT family N-acetyltransferase [candidate division CSSED10-310 bacterium]